MSSEFNEQPKSTVEKFYESTDVQKIEIEDATIAVRVFGSGPAIVFIHGYPVHGYTWRKLLPTLADKFTCYVIDLPGLGDSDWTAKTDFTFTAQASRLDKLFKQLNLDDYALIAHDTGATIARLVALLQPEKVSKLVIINTEIPHHRPPWIRFYQFNAKVPLAHIAFQTLLKSDKFLQSSMGLGEFYTNSEMLKNDKNLVPYSEPLLKSTRRMKGMLGYLKGIEWEVVDSMKKRHKDIKAETLFLWGEDDKTFPVELGEKMCEQFAGKCEFVRIENASLMPHEEKPNEVLRYLIPFLS